MKKETLLKNPPSKAPYTVQATKEYEAEIRTLLTEINAITGVSKSRIASECLIQSLRAKKKLL